MRNKGGVLATSEDEGAPHPPPRMFGVLDVGAAAAGDVVAELSSFTTFRRRVDELLRTLKGSPAGPHEVGQQRVARDQFGGGAAAFHEASGLFASYDRVIAELETLSTLLADSLEGMGIAVLASHEGYQNIDEDVRRRMAAISEETRKHYGPAPARPAPAPGKPRPGGDTGGTI
ncbi:hypothetical protein [Streptomyces sp. NPDC048111]|uniref:hypothetical protein n=1 Tax=Streptomyces sp. NPDC048111 TaxID=3365500 RepID=UPI00372016D1